MSNTSRQRFYDENRGDVFDKICYTIQRVFFRAKT